MLERMRLHCDSPDATPVIENGQPVEAPPESRPVEDLSAPGPVEAPPEPKPDHVVGKTDWIVLQVLLKRKHRATAADIVEALTDGPDEREIKSVERSLQRLRKAALIEYGDGEKSGACLTLRGREFVSTSRSTND